MVKGIHFWSDPHFGHGGVIRFCNRPFVDVTEMNEALIRKYNSRVGPKDLVYHLGDMAFTKFSEAEPLFRRLQGRRILVQGNHDKFSAAQYAKLGYDAVVLEAKIHLAGHSVRLSHYPYAPTEEQRRAEPSIEFDTRYLDRRPKDQGDWLLHGHVHCAWKQLGRMINCGVDVWNFYPVSGSQIESILNAARKEEGPGQKTQPQEI